MEPQVWKLVQKRSYDLLSHRYGLLMIFGGTILIVVSAFHFGEALLEWSHEKYASVFNSYSDNLAGRSFRERLCLPVPIDVVYTWVNGSDPHLILELRKVKMSMEEQLNITRKTRGRPKPGQCTYSNCVPAPVVVVEGLAYTEAHWTEIRSVFDLNNSHGFNYTSLGALGKVESMAVTLASWEEAKSLKGHVFLKDHVNYTLAQGFYTSDSTLPHGATIADKVLMTGFPSEFTSEKLLSALPADRQKAITKVEVHSEKGVAVLHAVGPKEAQFLLQVTNFTIEGKHPAFTVAYLVSNLADMSRDGDVANSRFEDNEELRYSLRSLERFAPWVRHVYIVTNGQIPHWLNLDSPRVSIITHEDLFPNKSHLPTFSSPAIEAHVHRIPGLSDKFLYLNDDVMFGKEVWPDDFYSQSTGQKLYLTWPVPSCNEGCPSNWIRDGYCDKACNSTECEWDGGDCIGTHGQVQLGAGFQAVFGQQMQSIADYCQPGCANNWLADKYCDQACNHLPCGFDAGDCGTDNYNQIVTQLLRNVTDEDLHYLVPAGETVSYFNLSEVVGASGKITSASHWLAGAVRLAAVSNKYRVLTLILYPGHNATTLHFSLHGLHTKDSGNFQLNFTVSVDSSNASIALKKAREERQQSERQTQTLEEAQELVLFEQYRSDMLQPHVKALSESVPHTAAQFPFNVSSNLTLLGLSATLQHHLSIVLAQRAEGDLTDKGYQIALAKVYDKHKPELIAWKPGVKASFKEPRVLKNLPERRSKGDDKFQQQPVKPFPGQRKLLVNTAEKHYNNRQFLEFLKAENKALMMRENGRLPWETKGDFVHLQERQSEAGVVKSYETDRRKGRQLLDTFGDSLRHVNRLYNQLFGFSARKVPAHMPHFIDKHIMAELQETFAAEWDVTSSHKVRSPDDMQFAFSYYYYILGAKEPVVPSQIFEEMDTDHSGILSDRELRTLTTRLNDLPLYLETLTGMETLLMNCSKHLPPDLEDQYQNQLLQLPAEVYYEKDMPQVTKLLFVNCPQMVKQVEDKFKSRPKYRTTTLEDGEVAFKMIQGNVSKVVGQLDDIRKNPKKFVCLNDNIDHGTEEARTVKAVIQDFYESLLPVQSQFELPRDYRNRFLHVKDLREWKKYRDWLRFCAHVALVLLVTFTIASYFGDKIEALQRKYSRYRHKSENESSSTQGAEESRPLPRTSPLLPV